MYIKKLKNLFRISRDGTFEGHKKYFAVKGFFGMLSTI